MKTRILLIFLSFVCIGSLIYFFLKKAPSEPLTISHSPEEKKSALNKPIAQNVSPSLSLPASLSPFDIKQWTDQYGEFDLTPLWQQLGISSTLQTIWPLIGVTDSEAQIFDKCGCAADLYKLNLDTEPGYEVLLNIHQGWGYSRYLVFKSYGSKGSKGRNWRFIGRADHDFVRYAMPEHRVATGQGSRWLVLRVQTGSGTGVAEYYDRWYEVGDRGVVDVLAYPASGHHSELSWDPARHFKATYIRHEARGKRETIEILFSVRFSGDGVKLWSKQQRAIYTRVGHSQPFSLDPTRSRITQREIDSIYRIDSYSSENFLKDNFAHLKRIAIKGDQKRKDWLKAFLEHIEHTPERESLRQFL